MADGTELKDQDAAQAALFDKIAEMAEGASDVQVERLANAWNLLTYRRGAAS